MSELLIRALINALRDGVKCAVADIDFCKTESREEAERVVLAEVPGATLGWHFFKNDPSACEVNIKSRNRDCLRKELGLLEQLSPSYRIPQDAAVFAVRGSTGRREEN